MHNSRSAGLRAQYRAYLDGSEVSDASPGVEALQLALLYDHFANGRCSPLRQRDAEIRNTNTLPDISTESRRVTMADDISFEQEEGLVVDIGRDISPTHGGAQCGTGAGGYIS